MNTLMLAAISGDSLLTAIVWLVIAALIFWVCWWGLGKLALPEPFNKIITVLLVLFVVLVVVNILLTLIGHPLIHWG